MNTSIYDLKKSLGFKNSKNCGHFGSYETYPSIYFKTDGEIYSHVIVLVHGVLYSVSCSVFIQAMCSEEYGSEEYESDSHWVHWYHLLVICPKQKIINEERICQNLDKSC